MTKVHGRTATLDERKKWSSYLVALAREQQLNEYQVRQAFDCWQRAIELDANVMYPSGSISNDTLPALYWTWGTSEQTLTAEFHPTHLEWFYASDVEHDPEGSDDGGCTEFPERFFQLMQQFTRPLPMRNELDIELMERLNAQMEAAVVEGKRLLVTGADTAGDTSGDDFNRAHAELTEHLLANLPAIIENAKWREAYDEQFPDLDPKDSIALEELRSAIDSHLGWACDEDEERGNYVERVREVGEELRTEGFKP